MEFYNFYDFFSAFTVKISEGMNAPLKGFLLALFIGFALWLALFILQGIGLYTMAKRRNIDKPFLAFIPFVGFRLVGKLSGETNLFGNRMKRAWLYALIASVVASLVSAALLFSEIVLYTEYGTYYIAQETQFFVSYSFVNLPDRYSQILNNLRDYGSYVMMIVEIVYGMMLFALYRALFRKYSLRNSVVFSWLTFFFPFVRYPFVFAVRNNKDIDYEAYMRARREAFMRAQQQQYNPYNPYGQNPYGQNPYGRPTYNQPPYGQNPYNQTPPPQQSAPSDPFGEFSKGGADDPFSNLGGRSEPSAKADGGADGKNEPPTDDDLFN